MQVKIITKYVSDDGISFNNRENALDREMALLARANVEAAQAALHAIQNNCNHDLVIMNANKGQWNDKFEIICMCCTKAWKEPHSDSYWWNRFENDIGLYDEDEDL